MNKKAFTLLELLVVVLIIGILAGVALPQYQYSVMKTKYMRMADIARVIKDAQERYYMINDQYTTHFSDLDIDLPIVKDNEDESRQWVMEDVEVTLASNQSKIDWYKNDSYYMMFALRLDNKNPWEGAQAMCAAYEPSGENGKKICNSFPNAYNCTWTDRYHRYSCRIP